MKSKIKLIPKSGKLEGIHVKDGRAQWGNRTLLIEGPAPKEIAHFEGFLPCNAWPTAIAGLAAPFMDIPWREMDPNEANWTLLTTDPQALSRAIEPLLHIAEDESARNYAQVIAFDRGSVVATDGFRLAYSTPPMDQQLSICLAKRSAALLAKLLKVTGAKIMVSEDRTILRLDSPTWKARFVLSAVKYPQWRGVLPKKNTETLQAILVSETADKASLLAKAKHDKDADTFRIELTPHLWVNPKFWAQANELNLDWTLNPADKEDPLSGRNSFLTYIIVPIAMPKIQTLKKA